MGMFWRPPFNPLHTSGISQWPQTLATMLGKPWFHSPHSQLPEWAYHHPVCFTNCCGLVGIRWAVSWMGQDEMRCTSSVVKRRMSVREARIGDCLSLNDNWPKAGKEHEFINGHVSSKSKRECTTAAMPPKHHSQELEAIRMAHTAHELMQLFRYRWH